MTIKDKKIKKELKNRIKSNYLIIALSLWEYNSNILSYNQFFDLIKNKSLFLIKNQNDYQYHFDYCNLFIAYLSDKEVKLHSFNNSNYELVEFILNKFNKYEDRIIEKKLKNVVGVRWLGAFNTNTTTKKHSFEECLNWEYSKKDREVACDVFSENIDFIYQYKNRVYNAYDNLYKRCKLAFVYSCDDIRIAYDTDIYSRQLGKMLVGSNEDYTLSTADNAEDFEDLEYHAEGILRVGARLQYLLIVDKDSWKKENLKTVEDFAIKNNIIILSITSKLDKYIFDNIDENIIKKDIELLLKCNKDEYDYLDFSKDYIKYLEEVIYLNIFEKYCELGY